MTPTDRQIRDHIASWRAMHGKTRSQWDTIEARLLEAARRDRGPSTTRDGFPSGHAGRGGDPTTSVESAALRDDTPDPVHRHVELAFDFLDQMTRSRNAMLNQLDAIARLSLDPARTTATCCEGPCEAAAVKAGRCRPCYQWRHDWANRTGRPVSEAPPVPADTIDARDRTDPRRVYVTGPLEGQTA